MCGTEEEAQKLSGRTHKCASSRSGYPVSLVGESGDVVAAVRHECVTRFAVKNQGEELKCVEPVRQPRQTHAYGFPFRRPGHVPVVTPAHVILENVMKIKL